MKLAKNANGSIPRHASGAVQQWETGCTTCCTEDVCGNDTGCTGDYVLTLCTGKRIVANVPDYAYSYSSTPNAADSTNYFLAASRSLVVQCDFDFSPPGLGPRDINYGFGIQGVYRHYERNGSSYTFDGTYQCGTAFTPSQSETDIPIPTVFVFAAPLPGGDFLVRASIDTVAVDETFDSLHTNATDSVSATATYNLSKSYIERHRGIYYDVNGTRNGTVGVPDAWAGDGAGGGYWDVGDGVYTLSHGATKTATAVTSGDLCGGDTLTATFGDDGTYSNHLIAFADFDDTSIGCRGCPRVLDISGEVWADCDPSTGAPGYEPTGDDPPPAILRSVNFSGRLVQAITPQCGEYSCSWTGTVTLSRSGFDLVASASITRKGPRLFYLSIGISSIADSSSAYFTTSDECPTSVVDVEQKPTPHEYTHTGSGLNFGGAPTGMGEFQIYTYGLVDPSTPVFTTNTLTVSAGACESTDPTHYCDDECASTASAVSFDINCDTGSDDPPGWAGPETLTKQSCVPCTYSNPDADGFTVKLWWDVGSSKWKYTVVYNLTGETALTGELLGSDTDPTGSYGYVSAQPFGAFTSWDDDCGSGLNAIVS